jgi:hypothetical protein
MVNSTRSDVSVLFRFRATRQDPSGRGEVADGLVRRGLDPRDRVMITIEPDELIPGRRAARVLPPTGKNCGLVFIAGLLICVRGAPEVVGNNAH